MAWTKTGQWLLLNTFFFLKKVKPEEGKTIFGGEPHGRDKDWTIATA